MTNADCIRRMSDDQLYDFLSEWECGDIDYSITFCDLCKQGGNELNLDCDGCREHWLKRDAVDYSGLLYWKKNTTYGERGRGMIGEEVIAYYGDAGDGEELFEKSKLVRCKDCKHNPKYTKGFQWGRCVCTREDDWFSYEPRDDFFCGYGERKDNE